jgi:hypothetical protein
MKIVIASAFLITSYCTCFSQSTADSLSARLNLFGQQLPADQVFIHTDRNIYYPGDTIHFQAYIRDRQTGVFETGSIALYAMLINENHRTIDSARFRIVNSTSSGWLKIPEAISEGDYSLLSFTSRMMNYDPEYIFSASLRIDRKRVFRSQPQTTRREGKDTLEYIIDPENEPVDLKFLPEGGTFVYGIKQRIAFNAVTSTGRNIKCKGKIYNQKGEFIADFRSGQFSPGIFEFTPKEGDTYFAGPGGNEFGGKRYPLPAPTKTGITLRVNRLAGSVIEAEVNSKNTRGEKYVVSLTMNNVLVLFKEITTDTLNKIRINTSELPAGTAYVTLFNNNLEIVAERPVFINQDKKLFIDIKPSNLSCKRGDETTITINTTDFYGNGVGSVVSVSVVDSTYGFGSSFPFQTLESICFFDNQFLNNLPGMIRQNGFLNIDDEEKDLLLMTYGWRKYPGKENSPDNTGLQINDYDYLTIINKGPEKKTRREITLTTVEGGEMISLKKDNTGCAVLHFDTLGNQVRQIMILPDNNPLKNAYKLNVKFPVNEGFIKSVKSVKPVIIKPEYEFILRNNRDQQIIIDSAIQIEEVKIRAPIQRAEVFYNKYQQIYQYASLSTLTKKEMTGCLNLEDILIRLNPYHIDTKNKKIYLRPASNMRGTTPPALIVYDDLPLPDKSYYLISDIPASQISSVTALKGKQGYAVYGDEANGGVIFITSGWKKMADGDFSEKDFAPARPEDDLMRAISVFRKEAQYYIPAKEEATMIPEYQVRPTLFWNGEILLDGKGPVKITFPNHMLPGKVIIMVNGVSFDNMPGSARSVYMIR